MASTFSKLNSEIRHNKDSGIIIDSRLSERRDDSPKKDSLSSIGKKKHDHAAEDELEEAKRERDEIRRLLRKENERNRRREQAGLGKSKNERDQDRDISEKIALGQAQPTVRDVMYD